MEVVSNSPIPQSLTWLTFTPFSEVEKHKSTETNLDILAIVIDISSPRSINGMYGPFTVHDLVLINDEKIPLVLGCWNDFITCEATPIIQPTPHFPIIGGLRLRAQQFRGVPLAVKGSPNLLLHPTYPATTNLKSWHLHRYHTTEDHQPMKTNLVPVILMTNFT